MKKYKNIIQYYIVEQMYNYKSKKVVEDKNGEIKKLLFGNADFCGNYIIIEPNGEYIKKYGEYQQDEIPKLIKKR
ncbi:hypothetical protein [Frigoriflavimonas asaccharolytica]|uniref:ABC-type cobalt transport system substrate-binding protein n=1 Tax=Frigoriflavimonas asaccharolytica TaxID=2735899 RepID=A0A8J8K4A4_9FLAO|nr:hypothetical protein [Frigoriflavimonas asaccharolytica]NRS91485.1 ABC-type cobalt transport system substrate-binding protein [Frigoriflavimonas asaccharolytica]